MSASTCCDALYKRGPSHKASVKAFGGFQPFCLAHEDSVTFTRDAGAGSVQLSVNGATCARTTLSADPQPESGCRAPNKEAQSAAARPATTKQHQALAVETTQLNPAAPDFIPQPAGEPPVSEQKCDVLVELMVQFWALPPVRTQTLRQPDVFIRIPSRSRQSVGRKTAAFGVG